MCNCGVWPSRPRHQAPSYRCAGCQPSSHSPPSSLPSLLPIWLKTEWGDFFLCHSKNFCKFLWKLILPLPQLWAMHNIHCCLLPWHPPTPIPSYTSTQQMWKSPILFTFPSELWVPSKQDPNVIFLCLKKKNSLKFSTQLLIHFI